MPGFPTLTSQVTQLASGSVSSVSLTLNALNAVKASQPTLNAFRVVCTKSALAEAAEADRRLAAGERLPLLGVPDRHQGRHGHGGHSHRVRHRRRRRLGIGGL